MQLFIDTADVRQIRTAQSWGTVDGVTTNPSHIAAAGGDPDELLAEIFSIVDGPVSVACPASILQRTAHATLYLDGDSAALLTVNE